MNQQTKETLKEFFKSTKKYGNRNIAEGTPEVNSKAIVRSSSKNSHIRNKE
ncbi:MAG: hypothetical protein H8D22_04115 [Candidatus Cloacimonetes bacterium]|nr:hypothetical protein [Candidatus Cloacimonadota bacterium]